MSDESLIAELTRRVQALEAALAEARPMIAARYNLGMDEEWRAFARRINDVPLPPHPEDQVSNFTPVARATTANELREALGKLYPEGR